MTVEAAELLVGALALYAVIGVVFALVFVSFGAARLDGEAKGMPLQARALIFWASAGLWPLLLAKWLDAPARADSQPTSQSISQSTSQGAPHGPGGPQ